MAKRNYVVEEPVEETVEVAVEVEETLAVEPAVEEAAPAAEEPVTTLPEPVSPKTVVVGSRDTWATLADRVGTDPSALADFNRMTIHSMLVAGSTLRCP
jgi:hypothetical protein